MSKLLASTLGVFVPKFKTIAQYAVVHSAALEGLGCSPKTISNRLCYTRYIVQLFGNISLAMLSAAEVYRALERMSETRPQTARSVFAELRRMLEGAFKAGWLDHNIMDQVKPPKTKVQRTRLTIQQWHNMYRYSAKNSLPWVPRMLLLALITGQRRADLAEMKLSGIKGRHLFVEQQKTGAKIAIPLSLRMRCINTSLAEVIDSCRSYGAPSDYMLHKSNGAPLSPDSLSARFETVREKSLGLWAEKGTPPSLHECRALAAWMYQEQGDVDIVQLLGHMDSKMTATYLGRRSREERAWRFVSTNQ